MRHITRVSGEELTAGFTTRTVVVGFFPGPGGAVSGRGGALVSAVLGIDLDAVLAADPAFLGRDDQLARVSVAAGGELRTTLVAVGLGFEAVAEGAAGVAPDMLRAAAMRAAASVGHESMTNTLALEGADSAAAARAVVEGTGLGDYRYVRAGAAGPGTGSGSMSGELCLVLPADESVMRFDEALRRGRMAVGASNWVRQLVETPGGALGPHEFAEAIARRVREEAPDAIEVSVWSAEQLVERGFGATIAVGSGSSRPPCVVELRSRAGGIPIALAGKGITFDAGGTNLKKDAAELAWMKSDMAAAAAVAAAVIAVAGAGVQTPFHVLLPIAENMPGGNAARPGDVVVHPDGRSTEVVDTDCEGRLVLADAIAWLAATKPRAIIDVGTLTDSGGVGTALWGCWTNTPSLGRALVDAGLSAGDPGWVLPLVPSYRSLLQSPVADSTNAAADVPDSGQLAATYLEPFAAGIPWLHLDNGSGAYLERDAAPWPKGATGTPTRALIDYLCDVSAIAE